METIICSVNRFLDKMKEVGYSKRNIDIATAALNGLIQCHTGKDDAILNYYIAERHIADLENLISNDSVGRWIMSKNIWFIRKFLDFLRSGEIDASHYVKPRFPVESEFTSVILQYVDDISTNDQQKVSHMWAIKRYAFWLSNHDIHSFSDAKVTDLRLFIIEDTNNLSSKTIPNLRSELRHFHVWLYDHGYIPNTYESLFDFKVAIENKIHPALLPDDAARILEQIDRTTAIGKRDYAMMLCGIVLGLRGCDIIRLKRTDINWYKGEICISQHKTGRPLALPLTTDVADALKDYILNGRPQCDEPNVFLRHLVPIGIFKSGSFVSQIFETYKKKAGIDFEGSYYSVRRAVGKNLTIAETPVTDVAQILGHTNIYSSTKQYINLDTKHLKICSLSFDGIRPRRWTT